MVAQTARNHATFGIISPRYKSAGAVFEAPSGVAKRRWRSLAMGSYTQLSFTEQVKRCHTCGQMKPYAAFSRAAHHRDGLNSSCRECRKAYCKGWYEGNRDYVREWKKRRLEVPGVREKNAERNKVWREANADILRAKRKAFYEQNRELILARDRAYRERHAEAIRERRIARYHAKPQKYRDRCRRWRQDNLDLAHALDRKYLALHGDKIRARARDRYHADRERYQAEQREYRERPEVKARLRSRSRAWREANRDRVYANVRRREYRIRTGVIDNDPRTDSFMIEVRRDPCSYCGGPGGTVDHIKPIARGGKHHWSNFAGACRTCNTRKQTKSALMFLYRTHRKGDT